MRTRVRRVARVVLASSLALLCGLVLAEGTATAGATITPFPCGRIVAFTPPTATTAGMPIDEVIALALADG